MLALNPDSAQSGKIWLSYICFVVSKGYPRWITFYFNRLSCLTQTWFAGKVIVFDQHFCVIIVLLKSNQVARNKKIKNLKTFFQLVGYLYNSHYTNLLQINLFGLKKGFMDINPFSFTQYF